MKFRIPFIIRLSIAIVFVTILLMSVDISQSIKKLSSVNLYTAFLLCGLMLLRRTMMAYKWNLLLRAQGIWISIFHSLRLYYIGYLIGSFTPGWIGLEAYRVNALSRFQENSGCYFHNCIGTFYRFNCDWHIRCGRTIFSHELSRSRVKGY